MLLIWKIPASMEKKPIHKTPLFWACVVSIAFLSLFCGLQAAGSKVIGLPSQLLWISILPIILVLIVGDYIRKLKVLGIEYERLLPDVAYIPPPQTQASVSGAASKRTPAEESASAPIEASPDLAWLNLYNAEKLRTNNFFLVHTYKPSTRQDMKYDVTVFLMRHVEGKRPNQREGFSDVERAEFCFGESWLYRVIPVPNEGGFIGVSTSAWGSFLAMCRVTFKDPEKRQEILYRYVDFEMAPQKA